MKRIIVVAAWVGFAITPAAALQRGSPANSLPRALSIFAAADADHDGRMGPDEARAIPISAEVFAAQDQDKDGTWSRDEFLLYYRHQLAAGGQPVGPDLQAEIARIQALKRVKVVEEAKKLSGDASARPADAESVEERLGKALADLEKRAAARQATREDFQRLRNLVILSGRATTAPGRSTQPAAAQTEMLQVLDRIEKCAALGQYPKEDFQALRVAAPRAGTADVVQGGGGDAGRAASGGTPRSGTQDRAFVPRALPAGTPPTGGPAEARRRAMEPRVEPRVEPPPRPSQTPIPAPAERPPAGKPEKDKPERSRP
jgi:phosphoglycolate phosphatase-like HAD superfamily hydrolase